MTLKDNKIEWKDRLEAAIDYLRYARYVFLDGQIVFSSLIACKAYEILTNDDEEDRRRPASCNSNSGEKTSEKRNIFKEKMEKIIPRIWEKPEDQEAAKKIFIRENKDESIENYPNIVRNRIIHRYYKADENLKKDTELLINKLFELPVIRDYKIINDKNYEERRNLEYKLGIINPDDVKLSDKKWATHIKQDYFENLILARKELIPAFISQLREEIKNLPKKYSFFKDYISEEYINVSTVDSTSSYVWITIKPKELVNRLDLEFKVRSQIYVPSFSLVFMPYRVWTYVELAGMNYWFKLRYYYLMFNETEKYYEFIKDIVDFDVSNRFDNFSNNKPCLIDAIWYVFDINEKDMSEFVDKKKFDRYIEQQKKFLKEGRLKNLTRRMRKQIPITWNISLPGYYDSYEYFKKPVPIKRYCKLILMRWISLYGLMEYLCKEEPPLPPFNSKYFGRLKKLEKELANKILKEDESGNKSNKNENYIHLVAV